MRMKPEFVVLMLVGITLWVLLIKGCNAIVALFG